jgi:hypothetical protein
MPEQNLAASLVATGSNGVAIPANFQRFSARNLRLTAAARPKDTSRVDNWLEISQRVRVALIDLLAGTSGQKKISLIPGSH